MPTTPFLRIPPEILRDIVIRSICISPIGMPHILYSLFLTCRSLYSTLSSFPSLYTGLLIAQFDSELLINNLGQSFVDNAPFEWRRRVLALNCIYRGDLDDPDLMEAFFVAFVLLLEDQGQNFAQLQRAGLANLVHRYLREKIFIGSESDNGWPLANEINALAVSIAWLTSSRALTESESQEERHMVMRSISPYVFAAFRYPATILPETVFPLDPAHPKMAASAFLTPPPSSCKELKYFGVRINLKRVPISLPAVMVHFSRLSTVCLDIPPSIPINRAAAEAAGHTGITQEDIEYFNSHPRIHFPTIPIDNQLIKQKRANYWHLLVFPLDRLSGSLDEPVYVPGAVAGHWRGSYVPHVLDYQAWLSQPTSKPRFEEYGPRPLYFTLREHFCYSPSATVPFDRSENGIINAWLPKRCLWNHHENGIEVYDRAGTFRCFYETFSPDVTHPPTRYRGVVDIIVTGETHERRGAAWGSYRFIGRVRQSDGLVVLLRELTDHNLSGSGNEIFRGYVTPTRNFVGRWKSRATEPETVFVVCKSNEP